MSLHETEYEEKLYNDRKAALDKIVAIARELNPGLDDRAARFPNSFPFTHTLTKSIEGVPALRPLGDDPGGSPRTAEDLEANPIPAAVAGRVVALRGSFAVLQQGGDRLQIWVHKSNVGDQLFALYKLLHLGDHVGVTGTLMRTKTGELSLKVAPLTAQQIAALRTTAPDFTPPLQPLTLLTKAMVALPDKYAGLEDVELRYRRRYVDLIMNSEPAPAPVVSSRPESERSGDGAERPASPAPAATDTGERATENAPNVRETFVKRAAILRAIRAFFDQRGYLEVETPMLHPVAGGATARPFTTHHNAEKMKLFLRIAPELYLKRLVVGGLDRVYEINRNFRNEGVSPRHNPEFTMLEFYQAYANYHDLMDLTQELIEFVTRAVNNDSTIVTFPLPQGPHAGELRTIDLGKDKWQKLSMREAIIKFWPGVLDSYKPSIEDFSDIAKVWRLAGNLGNLETFDYESLSPTADAVVELCSIVINKSSTAGSFPTGKFIADLFEVVSEEHLIQPTIIYDFPLAVSPLSKVKPSEPDWTERFEFYIGGFEVGNAFSELNDAADQEARFEDQLRQKAAGDDEAMAEMDSDYVRALGYGLPPTAGEGIGIDRLTMILTGSRSIRDVILFPLMRPEKKTELQKEEEAAE